jgi:molybdopterin molybdotransferase
MIEIDEAQAAVLERAEGLAAETVELSRALGRVLAVDVASEAAVPPFDSTAMDGFAVRHADVQRASADEPARLVLAGESRAGRPSSGALAQGTAIAISTGAMLPEGADAVVALEQAERCDGRVEVREQVREGANIRRAGDDMRAGQAVLAAGRALGPAELGVLASLGRAEIACVRRARVGVITTGDELVAPGERLAPGQIYNSNAFSVAALVRQCGAELASVTAVGDELLPTRAAIARALAEVDVVVLCGGVSVGEHDHVRRALAELGVRERFWGVAVKPGKPTWFGERERELVFGLPGNPVSAMVTFALFIAPALRALEGRAQVRRRASALLAHEYRKAAGRAHALRCRLRMGERGLEAESAGDTGSHVLTSMLGAQALALIPSGCEHVRAGSRVELELLGEPALNP